MGEPTPTISEHAGLIIMGGPQSPLEPNLYPYIQEEIALTKLAIVENKLVLGFCLGAQIISEALGGATSRSPEKEIGIFPISLTEAGQRDPIFAGFPKSFDVIHWHNDMPGIPEGAELLATSEGCPQQAFSYKGVAYGFQFHMEITNDGMNALADNCPGDLKPSRFTQTEEEIRSVDTTSINQQMKLILDRVFARKSLMQPTHQA